jgi:protein-L-isoaspartate(D-aspartate) O-methyltransferase
MDSKRNMINSVKKYLSIFGRIDSRIIESIKKIDRKYFVKDPQTAYLDSAIRIGEKETISQPSTVARMLSLLELKKGQNILEIGTGSGWNAALIAFLVDPGKVTSLEISEEMVKFSKKNIKVAGIKNIRIIRKNFKDAESKFDRIVFSAGTGKAEEKEIEKFGKLHLKNKGIMLFPMERGPIIILKKKGKSITKSYTPESYFFVPLREWENF